MNIHWKTFLLARQGVIDQENKMVFPDIPNNQGYRIYPLTQLGVLSVSGQDAAKFLQGQITCNVYDVNANQSCLAAMCNAKGRVVATFIITKKDNMFLLVLPNDLVEAVRNKLQMYVLRSDVKITDNSNDYGLLGMVGPEEKCPAFSTESLDEAISIVLPHNKNRKLLISGVENAIKLWASKTETENYRQSNTAEWCELDIEAGIPWLTNGTSEAFIPQMLNLDKLGGISFTKGCYIGQEVVARTHYLGKVKREMYLAESQLSDIPQPNSPIINTSDGQIVGHVLQAQLAKNGCKLLVILPTNDIDHNNLVLKDYNQAKFRLLPFQI